MRETSPRRRLWWLAAILPIARVVYGGVRLRHHRSAPLTPAGGLADELRARYPARQVQGRSLLPLLAGHTDEGNRYVFSRAGGSPSKYLVRSKDYALMLYSNGRWCALYDLRKDLGERDNVIEASLAIAERVVAAFRAFARQQRRPPVDFLDPSAAMPPLPDVPEIKMRPEDRARTNRIADLGCVR